MKFSFFGSQGASSVLPRPALVVPASVTVLLRGISLYFKSFYATLKLELSDSCG